ncbi:MAG: MFS transporter, partial [Caldilineaceae bacterium]|nr:MFS transporter [Caldilineaceae bacterium]
MDTTSNEHKWRILAALAGVIFMASLIFNSAAVVLPDIVREFRINFATGQWVLLSYTLVQVSVMPIVGRLGDMLGKRPVFLGGTIAFMVTSILPGLAPTIELLILFRVLQAVGAAFAIALNY